MSQQALFLETITNLKKALKRSAYDSDSDDTVGFSGNRGHKLKKRARFAQRGLLSQPTGCQVQKVHIQSWPQNLSHILFHPVPIQAKILSHILFHPVHIHPRANNQSYEYAGVKRDVIRENPPLLDDDGYEVFSDEDDPDRIQEAEANAAAQNPYAGIQLEKLLAPLTSVTDLASHPTLSRPFLSQTLTQLADQSSDLSRRENNALWGLKRILEGFYGDFHFCPTHLMLGPNDAALFSRETMDETRQRILASEKRAYEEYLADHPTADHTTNRQTTDHQNTGQQTAKSTQTAKPIHHRSPQGLDDSTLMEAQVPTSDVRTNMASPTTIAPRKSSLLDQPIPPTLPPTTGLSVTGGSSSATDLTTAPLQALTLTAQSQTQAPRDEPFIHPYFQTPAFAQPDRNLGLPEAEAEDVRRLMVQYVQKQEEICRGATRLYEGLLKAERLRQTVLHWSKAEAHCGDQRDLSDGEDWYDPDDYGLTEALPKGVNEEEEEEAAAAAAASTKKTRGRK